MLGRRSLAALAFGAPLAARAEAPPPDIRMIVPFAAGGATDLLARRLQPLLEARGHKLVVENITGGGSMVGMSRLLQARPDGRSLGMGSSGLIGQIAANEIPLRLEQFALLARVAVDPLVLIAGAASRFRSLADAVAALRSGGGPGIGAAGPPGTIGHLRLLGLAEEVRGQFAYVAYPGASRVATELLGGHLDLAIVKPNDVFGQIRSGALRVLAVMEEARLDSLPEVPSLAEAGIAPHPFGRLTQMTFVVAPAGLSPAMQGALTALLREAILSPEYQALAERDGYLADALAGEALAAAVQETHAAIRRAQERARA